MRTTDLVSALIGLAALLPATPVRASSQLGFVYEQQVLVLDFGGMDDGYIGPSMAAVTTLTYSHIDEVANTFRITFEGTVTNDRCCVLASEGDAIAFFRDLEFHLNSVSPDPFLDFLLRSGLSEYPGVEPIINWSATVDIPFEGPGEFRILVSTTVETAIQLVSYIASDAFTWGDGADPYLPDGNPGYFFVTNSIIELVPEPHVQWIVAPVLMALCAGTRLRRKTDGR